jgi:protein-disulfide isomerase
VRGASSSILSRWSVVVIPSRVAACVRVLLCCVVLASISVHSAAADEFSPGQRRAIEGIVRDYLLRHPDVLIDSLRQTGETVRGDAPDKAEQTLVTRRGEIFDDPQTPVGGDLKGDVTLVEFFDYRCPYCKKEQPILEELVRKDRKLRLAYKEFPILGEVSVIAARAALAARRQGKYEAFHDAMMAATGNFTADTVYKVALSVGLDLDQLKRDMAAPQITAALKANRALADALGVRGTPTFVIGDQLVPGAIDLESLEQLIADARRKNRER